MTRPPRPAIRALAWLLGVVVLVVVALAVADDGPVWREVEPGLAHMRVGPPDGDAELLRFDLERFAVDVVMPGPSAAVTARALRARTGALAVVNGGFFDTAGRTLGLRIGHEGVLQGLRPRVDWGVLMVRDDQARIVHSRDYPGDAGVTAAVQVGPRLVVAGKPVKLKPQSARRTAVAVDAGGRRLTLVTTRAATSAAELAKLLARLKYEDAMMLDGGPSTQLSARVGDLSLEVEGSYAVPDLLLVSRR